MLWTIFVVLVILWLLGLVSGYTIGGFHTYTAGYRNRSGVDQNHSGTKAFGLKAKHGREGGENEKNFLKTG